MQRQFENKVVLVTGGSSGIGRASARAFAQAGARVIIFDLDLQGAEETVRLILQEAGDAQCYGGDVSKTSDVQGLFQWIAESYGHLNCAHNNAGVEGALAPTAEYGEDNWDRVLRINLKGTWLCLKFEIQQMLKQGGGVIVNTSSVAGLVGVRNLSAYTASKHAIIGLTKSSALEYAQKGIRINAVCPGFIATPMTDRLSSGTPGGRKKFLEAYPIGRMGTPEEVAEAVLWLCSDAASLITGHALSVDGGRVAG